MAAWIWYGPGWLRRRHRRTMRLAFRDEGAIPAAAVLIGEQDEVAGRSRARGPASLDEQHQREQPHDLRFVGMSSSRSRPRRMASVQRSSRTSRSPELAV